MFGGNRRRASSSPRLKLGCGCSFQAFWSAVEEGTRRRLAREKTDLILKAVVKRFFNEKEVTSTLVMDALYSGCKALDYRSRNKKGKINGVDMEEAINPIVWVDKDAFVLAGDVLLLLERVVSETLPPYKDDKGPQNRTKVWTVLHCVCCVCGGG